MPKSPPVASYVTARRWIRSDARAALAALAASGLSASGFAAREGLEVQRLRVWSRKLAAASHNVESMIFGSVQRTDGDAPDHLAVRA